MTDPEILGLLKRSPEDGMKALMRQYTDLLFAVARGRLAGKGTDQDAEDAVSETFAEFYRSKNRFDPEKGTLKGFLCGVARHKAAKIAKKLLPLSPEEPSEDEADDFDLETEFIHRLQKKRLADAIRALGEPDREIIVRKFFFGESSKRIGEKTGLSPGAVDTRTHRALKKLRDTIGKEDM
ncbi:MAG: sigma-70 family RNA polymerase sigma factor [Clostridia bacterium]|nr:sigma-70 family RNA polymerase sigma factor [Clostridia bacterium]